MTAAAGAGVIRKRRGGLQVQVFAGRDPLTGRKRWVSRQVPGQTKAAYRQAKKVEAELLEQVDRGERRDGRSRTVGEPVERWLEWRQQVRPISPVTVANYRGAIDRYIIPNLGRANLHEVDAATLDTLYACVRATGGKCRHCWKRIRRGEPALRAGVRYQTRPGTDEAVHEPDCARGVAGIGLRRPRGSLGPVRCVQAGGGVGLDRPQPGQAGSPTGRRPSRGVAA